MNYDFDNLPPREGTDSTKYDGRERVFGRGDIIPMWVADMDFAVAPAIVEALQRRAADPVYGYSFAPQGYYDSIAGWLRRRHGWRTEREWYDFTPGVVPGLAFAIRAVSAPGEGIVINPPVYHPFARMIRNNGRALIESQLVEVGGAGGASGPHTAPYYTFDWDDLDAKLAEARAILLCNPQNPTGRVFTREELLRLGELCIRHNVVIISDEIHSDIIMPGYRHTPIATLGEDIARRTITFFAPSKTFNLAGLATSYAVTPDPALRQKLRRELDASHVEPNLFGTVALQAAYTEGEEWLREAVAYIAGNMDYVADFIARNIPLIRTRRSEGTYMMWLDCRALGMDQKQLQDFFVDRARLGLNEGAMFGAGGEGFMRINLATSRAVVEQAMAQLAAAVEQLPL